jgi:hypothetical protein
MREDGIAPNDAVIIGDRNSDIEAGQALGINDLSYLAETGHATTEKYKTKPLTLFQICRGRPNYVVDVGTTNRITKVSSCCSLIRSRTDGGVRFYESLLRAPCGRSCW